MLKYRILFSGSLNFMKPLRTLPAALLLLFFHQTAWADATQPATASEVATSDTQKNTDNLNETEATLTPKYPIEIVADVPELGKMLEEHLPLIAYQRK